MDKKIYIITGGVETGKTRWFESFINFLDAENKAYAGLICPGIWDSGQKLGIDAVLLPNKIKINLAMRKENNEVGFLKKWNFRDAAISEINEHFSNLPKNEFLFVDEIGPLEIERGEGFTKALEILKIGEFEKAFVVVRRHLIEAAKKVFSPTSEIEIIDIEKSSPNNFESYI